MNTFSFQCTACGTKITVTPGATSRLKCPGCPASYPVQGSVIDFLPQSAPARGLARAAMEVEPIVRIYESCLWRRSLFFAAATRISFAREQKLIMAAAGLRDAQIVLDLACGPGIYSREIARELRDGWVIGLDLSLAMLKHADRLAEKAGIRNLLFVRANAATLPVQPQSIDAVICCGALHLFSDPGLVLKGVFNTLRPGGRIILAVFHRSESRSAAFRDRIRRRLYGVASFTAGGLKSLLENAGFSDVQYHHAQGVWMIAGAVKP
jgi:SAM-dependent methyltransferase